MSNFSRTVASAALAICWVSIACAQAPSDATYTVINTLNIGGPGRWDYATIDPDTNRLYLTRSTHEQVIDTNTGKVVADFGNFKGTHGTALVPGVGRGFITDGRDPAIIVFDLKTNTVIGKIAAPDDADGIIYDASDNLVLVSCGDAAKLVVMPPDIDLTTGKPGEVDLGGKPEFLAADGHGKAYVTVNDKNELAVVDLKTLKVISRWPTGSGTAPTGMAIDPTGQHLFVGCRNQKMIVMSSTDGKVLAELPIGKGVDACGFDPGTGEAFASCGDSTLTVIKETSPGKFDVSQTVKTVPGARTLAVNPSTHTIYLPTAQFEPATQPGRRPAPKPDSFIVVVVGRQTK
jgi:DNA-binding beta-propeller fold protein YncE